MTSRCLGLFPPHPFFKGKALGTRLLVGMEECQSPFGIYEVKMPVNKNLECGGIGITGNNCKYIDVSVYSEILFYER